MRVLECLSLLTAGEAVMHASIARRASSSLLGFQRLDFPSVDPPEWRQLLPIRKQADGASVRDLPLAWHLLPPHASTCEENYRLHAGANAGGR
jgi:hypothetical protein